MSQGNREQETGLSEEVKATIAMEDGSIIELELYPKAAPQSVYNFVHLARQGYYDGLIFHRVINGILIQGGDPEGTGMGGPGYSIMGEFNDNGFDNPLKHVRGAVSMARKPDPAYDSAGSQFFIALQNLHDLDGSYAVFGNVTEGMEYIDQIGRSPTDEYDRPVDDIIIKSITIDGAELPEPDRIL
jgi:peptidyl-prolyl cis-trans isomerase B (cyclophilin B)